MLGKIIIIAALVQVACGVMNSVLSLSILLPYQDVGLILGGMMTFLVGTGIHLTEQRYVSK